LGTYILRRLLIAVPSLLGISVVLFVVLALAPGDPFEELATNPNVPPEVRMALRASLGLDDPVWTRYLHWLTSMVRGDWGFSFVSRVDVVQLIVQRLPTTFIVIGLSQVLAILVALPVGILAAVKPYSWFDRIASTIAFIGFSLPTFFTGLLLAYVFYFLLGWAPSPLGRLDPMFSPPPAVTGFFVIDGLLAGDPALAWAAAKQLVLPVATMALFVLAPIARMTRASMLAVLSADFVRTARASGLSSGTVLVTYALRNALLPVVTTLGMVFGFMLGSSVIVEKVFAWPGVGSYAIDALTASDYAPVQGFVLAMGVLFVLLNLLVDVLYVLIDPRVEMQS
jgi:peptide/nickel transport system permease protein